VDISCRVFVFLLAEPSTSGSVLGSVASNAAVRDGDTLERAGDEASPAAVRSPVQGVGRRWLALGMLVLPQDETPSRMVTIFLASCSAPAISDFESLPLSWLVAERGRGRLAGCVRALYVVKIGLLDWASQLLGHGMALLHSLQIRPG